MEPLEIAMAFDVSIGQQLFTRAKRLTFPRLASVVRGRPLMLLGRPASTFLKADVN